MDDEQPDWARGLHLGVEALDSGHQAQIQAITALEKAIRRGADLEVVRGLLAGVVEETQIHFAEELEVMRETAFPGMEAHAREHRRLLHQLRNVEMVFSEGQMGIVTDLLSALQPWLSEHIQKMDRVLASHLRHMAGSDGSAS